ncbi:related to AUT4-breakdown of autophagic vesicles inside the vacuole [Phialocephala subalpina]|uniref:Autophagy-related protein n=1 Tax=Phialocephala subalpina TaxID=576137 RepID=A0A1L7XCC7_9HELO|nr:related to AUT4-breakdown of autophagic vesicles inside the vacuole [Phialocephala subalpina]
MATIEEYKPEGEGDHISKLAFTAVAAPGPTDESTRASHEIRDLDQYTPSGAPATRKEVWSYYAYYAGNNGIGSFQYSNLLFQNLIYQAGFNPNILPLGSSSCDVDPTAPCHVFWGGGNKTKAYTSVILIGNGLTFLAQAIVFIGVGSLADYGNWNPWVVRGFSVLCWAFEFGFLGITKASQWRTAMAVYILCSITFWASYVFFNAIFPKLAHDLPELRQAKEELLNGSINEEQFEYKCSMARSKIMNISYVWNNVGFTVCCALSLGALFGVGANDSTQQNNWGYSVSVAVCTGFWIIFAIPWFLWEKKRPGPKLPKGDNYLTFGFKQTWFAAKQAWTLKQTFFYLIAFFLLADGINTTITLVSISQTQVVAFSATYNTYLITVQGASAAVGVFSAYYTQKIFHLRTKTMLQWTNAGCVLVALWGMPGIWTTKIGYHNLWEFWLYQAQQGFTIGAQFSYGQAFMAELVPRGREYMFFSLLGIVSKGSAWIGPIVASAIVDRTGNQWAAYPWSAALTFFPFVGIFFISEVKSKKECTEYLAREATDLRKVADDQSVDTKEYNSKNI